MFEPGTEPEDILADVDTPATPGTVPGRPQPPPVVATSFGPRRWPFVLLGLVVLAGAGAAGWFFFLRPAPDQGAMMQDTGTMTEDTGAMTGDTSGDTMIQDTGDTMTGDTSPQDTLLEPEPIVEPEPTEPVVPPEEVTAPPDADGDGLIDSDERVFGTNPLAKDTDGDGLSDGDEVHVYGSDPVNPDTDGDTYLDGQEVAGCYDPNGPGQLDPCP